MFWKELSVNSHAHLNVFKIPYSLLSLSPFLNNVNLTLQTACETGLIQVTEKKEKKKKEYFF